MKTLFLAAGYGTRLQKDISTSPEYKHLSHLPKALLPLHGKPLLSHWINTFNTFIPQDTYILTNDLYYPQFVNWSLENQFPCQLLNNGTKSNDTRKGSVGDLQFALDSFPELKSQDLLVIASDTLFLKDFSLNNFVHSFEMSGTKPVLVTAYTVDEQTMKQCGIIEYNLQTNLVENFLEKPLPFQTNSRWACPCFYMLPHSCLPLLQTFLDEKKSKKAQLSEYDATGKWMSWLVQHYPIQVYRISGRLDIGGLASYKEADTYLKSV
jgi:glucose-1-phosphate thymidylyltransferase